MGIVYSGAQHLTVRIEGGAFNGTELEAINHLNTDLEKDKIFKVGDKALAMLTMKEGKPTAATLIDHYRIDEQALLFALFGLLLTVFGGVSGFGALVSLVASVMIVWKWLIPLVLAGYSPILGALVTVLVLTVLIDLLVAGFSRVALTAILGSLLGTLVTGILSFAFGNLLKLDGTNLPYVVPILSQSSMQLNIREIFLSMVFIANSGALMDLSMDIASASEELIQNCPDISSRQLLKSGFAVGRNVIGTMTTTLMLAYSGSYLSLLMYFQGQGTPVIDILNLKYVASEILTTLVGSFGLVTVAPFSAIMAAALHKFFPNKRNI